MSLDDKIKALFHINDVCNQTHNIMYDKVREYYKLEELEFKARYLQLEAEYILKQDKNYLTNLREKGL